MQDIKDVGHMFMIKVGYEILNYHVHQIQIQPFKYNPLNPDREPEPIHGMDKYIDIWNDDHVRMPCSPFNVTGSFISK